jgi:hypothetical protein
MASPAVRSEPNVSKLGMGMYIVGYMVLVESRGVEVIMIDAKEVLDTVIR